MWKLRGMVVALFVIFALNLRFCYANDALEKLKPSIVYESDGHVASKIRQKTGRDEIIVRKNKITGSPHSIIAPGLEVPKKFKIKGAVTNVKSKTIEGKKRLRGDVLSTAQQEIDNAGRAFIKENKDILLADEASLKLLNIQEVRSKVYVTYQEYYNDIPVYQAIVNLL